MPFPIHALIAAHYHSFQALVPFIVAYVNPNAIKSSGFSEVTPSFKEALFIENENIKKIVVSKKRTNWNRLHQAVCSGYVNGVTGALTDGVVDWRNKTTWDIADKNQLVNPNKFSSEVTALEMAACLGHRGIVQYLLKRTTARDKHLIQEAYDGACNFRQVGVLYAFLNSPYIKHSYQALVNAASEKDLQLFQILIQSGAPLQSPDKKDSILVNALLHSKKDPNFALAQQRIVLTAVYKEKRKRKTEEASHDFIDLLNLKSEHQNLVVQALQENNIVWLNQLMVFIDRLPTFLQDEHLLGPSATRDIGIISEALSQAGRS